MRLAIVGGKLQGIECAYLAEKAGYDAVVIDRCSEAPALSLVDEAAVLDVTVHEKDALRIISDCDAVLPANEDLAALAALERLSSKAGVPLLFDLDAYRISSSKLLSNDMLSKLDVPMPRHWPECGYPVVVKPSSLSGSTGVMKASSQHELDECVRRIEELGDEAVVQEFVDGPGISIEVIGDGEDAIPLVITEVLSDHTYDCWMVRCPFQGLLRSMEEFEDLSSKIARQMSLRGIMDVEAIVQNGVPKVLEVDARMPSQTPAAVYNATGMNMIKVLVDALVHDRLERPIMGEGAAIYEHIAVDGGVMMSCGEGTFAQVRAPRVIRNLFGSDEMITDYLPGRKKWRATIICTGATPAEAWDKRNACIMRIIDSARISRYEGPGKEMMQ
ncbi:MAG: 3-methylornithine--L-lysine ligase PylC [Methanomassiliicoccaceae archaeon]